MFPLPQLTGGQLLHSPRRRGIRRTLGGNAPLLWALLLVAALPVARPPHAAGSPEAPDAEAPAARQDRASQLEEARRLFEAHDLRGAQHLLEQLVSRDPLNGPAWELLGRCLEDRWLFERAAEAYQKALDLQGERSDLIMRWVATRGQSISILSAIFRVGRLRDAAARALELDPGNVEARAALAAYYELLPGIAGGDKSRARRLLDELVAISPADGHALLGLQSEQQGHPDSIKVRHFETALGYDPDHQGSLLALGNHWIGREQLERGLVYYRQAVAAHPDDPQVYLSYGRALRHADRIDEGAGQWRRAVQLDPYFAPARFLLAEYHEGKGEREEAIRHYSRLALNNPTYKDKEVRQRLQRLLRGR